MIIDAYDPESEAVISPASLFGEQTRLCRIAIGTFSREIHQRVLEAYPHEMAGELQAANRTKPIHIVSADGLRFAFYLSEIGSALASTDMIEVNWITGADSFILFGSAGSLDREATEGRYVIPTHAYRDEGMSYHYAPPSDYIKISGADRMTAWFDEMGLPYVRGRVWTTDAFYRETRNQVRKRKAEGCVAVEMELAGLQAVSNAIGIRLYDFLVTGDVVNQAVYSSDGLYEANHSMDKMDAALAVARFVAALPEE